MDFDDLPAADRAKAAHAASQFLLSHDFASFDEACRELETPLQELWDRIMSRAGLPPCRLPSFFAFH